MSLERVLAHFREQAVFCTSYGSPFTGELIAAMADDLESGGPTAALVGDWPTNPRADALSLRLAGALHFAVLSNRDAALAALYPGYAAAWSMSEVWPVARGFLDRERGWVADFIRSAPQTNETRRSIALLAGFLLLKAIIGQHHYDLGHSCLPTAAPSPPPFATQDRSALR